MMEQAVANLQQTIAEKVPEGLITAEHTDTAHFYRYQPTGELYESTTRFTGMLDAPYLKTWAAKLAVTHMYDNHDKVMDTMQEDICQQAIQMHETVLNDAGTVGTLGHEAVERWLLEWIDRGPGSLPAEVTDFILPDEQDKRVWAIARSAQLFMQEWGAIPVASELLVAHPKDKYAGTLDGLKYIPVRIQAGDGSCGKDLKFGDFHIHNFSKYKKEDEMVCFGCNKKVRYELAVTDWKTSNSIDKVEYAMQTSAYRKAFEVLTGIKPKHQFIIQLDKHKAKYNVARVTNYKATYDAFLHLRKLRDLLYTPEGEKLLHMEPAEEAKKVVSIFD